ncbi:RNA-splicing factor [Coemansia sp. IMI 203386]|nr:RNA-splicing factor [Coemansia sp. IMI 203386]
MSVGQPDANDKSTHDDCEQPVVVFKKSKRRGANIRKRAADSDDFGTQNDTASAKEAGKSSSEAVVSSRPTKVPRTSVINTSALQAGHGSDSLSKADEKSGDAQNAADGQQPEVEYHFKRAMDSTRTVEPEVHSAHKGSRKPTKKSVSETLKDKDAGDAYTGKTGYTNRVSGTGSRRAGPFKAPTNVRSTSVFDYQPNVCKDYKETGYCGYGDSCIFLHDRGTYKSGWQLEKEFEDAQAGVKRENPKLWTIDDDDDDEPDTGAKDDSDELPFACLICRKPFQKPVVTKCQHYFCEACALKNYRKTPKCFACGAATGGVFKPAKKLAEKAFSKGQQNVPDRSRP